MTFNTNNWIICCWLSAEFAIDKIGNTPRYSRLTSDTCRCTLIQELIKHIVTHAFIFEIAKSWQALYTSGFIVASLAINHTGITIGDIQACRIKKHAIAVHTGSIIHASRTGKSVLSSIGIASRAGRNRHIDCAYLASEATVSTSPTL